MVVVGSDEVVGRDGVIRGLDGAERDRVAPCTYARYTLGGAATPPDGWGEAAIALACAIAASRRRRRVGCAAPASPGGVTRDA